jgi:hypothetical protein
MGGIEGGPTVARHPGFDPGVGGFNLAGATGGVEKVSAHITRGDAEAAAEAEVDVGEVLANAHAQLEDVGGAGVHAGGVRLVGKTTVDVVAEPAHVAPDVAAALGEGVLASRHSSTSWGT